MDCYRCLIQWGINTGGAVRTSTLPIPFTNVFLAVASTSSEWCCPGCSATNTTVTTRAYQSNRPDVAQPNDVNWIIIGCQPQWGKILGDTVNLKIINFPVSFNECFGGLALFNGDPVAAAEYATITDITNTNFKIYMYANNAGTGYANANIFYLFLGAQQQWGNSWSGYTGVFNWYFPISPSQVYAACLTKHTKNISSSHNWEPARVEEWNNSYARIHPDGDLGYSVIAICKAQQQWGKISNNRADFPIAFTNFCSAATLFIRGSGTGTWYGDNANVTLTGLSCITPDYVLNGNFIVIGV